MVLTPGFGFDFGHIGPIDSACLGKRILRAFREMATPVTLTPVALIRKIPAPLNR